MLYNIRMKNLENSFIKRPGIECPFVGDKPCAENANRANRQVDENRQKTSGWHSTRSKYRNDKKTCHHAKPP